MLQGPFVSLNFHSDEKWNGNCGLGSHILYLIKLKCSHCSEYSYFCHMLSGLKLKKKQSC